MWIIFALLSAFFAALTSVLAKVGIENVNSNLATAIRTLIVVCLAWIIVFFTGSYKEILVISQKSLIFLLLSGLMTGLSWLCYFKAIQIGDVTNVASVDKFSIVIILIVSVVFLSEPLTLKAVIGAILITLGTLVFVLF